MAETRGPKGIIVLSRERAEAYTPDPGEVCISITSPGAKPAALHEDWHAVLRLQFADDCWSDSASRHVGITVRDADRAVAFFARFLDAPRFVIHCEAGVSRSVSMADALAWCFGCRHLLTPTPICNPNVFVAIIAAWRRSVGAPSPTPETET
jgi:hypothetical protein